MPIRHWTFYGGTPAGRVRAGRAGIFGLAKKDDKDRIHSPILRPVPDVVYLAAAGGRRQVLTNTGGRRSDSGATHRYVSNVPADTGAARPPALAFRSFSSDDPYDLLT